MGRNRKRAGIGTIQLEENNIVGGLSPRQSRKTRAATPNTPTPVQPIQETPPTPPKNPIKPVPTEVSVTDSKVKKAQDALKKAQEELRELNRTYRRLKVEDEDLRQLLLLQGKAFNGPSAAERQSASRKLRTELAKRGIAERDLRKLRDATYDKSIELDDKKNEIEQKIKDAQYQLITATSPIDFAKKPKTSGKAQPQGPIKIDMARMSPEEIVDRIEKYAKGKTSGQFYQALFESLRHPSAARQEVSVQGGLSSANIKALVDGMYGMFDKSKMKQKGMLTIRVQPGLARSSADATYNPNTHTISLTSRTISPETIVHEIAHALQRQFSAVNNVTEKWAEHRIVGEKPLRQGNTIRRLPGTNIYRDHVDNEQTLMEYTSDSRGMRFSEVLTTAIEGMPKASRLRDKQLFMTFIRAVQEANGYY